MSAEDEYQLDPPLFKSKNSGMYMALSTKWT